MNHNRHISQYFLIALLLASCDKEPMPIIPSSVPISFNVSYEGMKGSTRASIFGDENATIEDFLDNPDEHPNDFFDARKGGGNFTMHAYIKGKTDANNGPLQYLDARVWWSKDHALEELKKEESARNFNNAWKFLEGNEQSGSTYEVYWPREDALNLFAYMPYNYEASNNIDGNGYSISQVTYSESNGPSFSCTMPETYSENEKIQEFVYAYVPNIKNGTVPLHFTHPFAVVYFQLELGSCRLEFEHIKLNNVCLNGTFSCYNDTRTDIPKAVNWTPTTDSKEEITFNINKKIPNDISFNTPFAGPFIVIPQNTDGITMTINSNRIGEIPAGDTDPNKDGDNDPRTYNISNISIDPNPSIEDTWEPGKKYIYKLTIGDGNKEIRLDVATEDWIIAGKTVHEIE